MYGMYFFLFLVLQFIATYKGDRGIIITISLHTYMCYLQKLLEVMVNYKKNTIIV